jgi:hypothetical protein
MKTQKVLGVRIPDKLREILEARAKALDVSFSDLVRDILWDHAEKLDAVSGYERFKK